ncbi:hypothetical protein [Leptospira wolbachii]|uniref:hypothetical protein n=1 Tax=Leptospira wolbachii TaxID=29511 RepID=UPI00058F3AEE|nr:hypothetical protein [Leptospira wolbachii]
MVVHKEWGEYKYLGNLASSPIRNLLNYPELESENCADKRAGAFGYGVGEKKYKYALIAYSSNINICSINANADMLMQFIIICRLGYIPWKQ